MNSRKTLSLATDDRIAINGASSINYWSNRFLVSPFTLFHLLRIVGNSVSKIGEFLHRQEQEQFEAVNQQKKDLTIL
jgi:hypothetical protein